MDELREELCIENGLMGRIVKSRMKWAGHFMWRQWTKAAYRGWHICVPGDGQEERTMLQVASPYQVKYLEETKLRRSFKSVPCEAQALDSQPF